MGFESRSCCITTSGPSERRRGSAARTFRRWAASSCQTVKSQAEAEGTFVYLDDKTLSEMSADYPVLAKTWMK